MARESGKEIQERLIQKMRTWQKIEDTSVSSTAKIMEKSDNPIIKMVMEIIHNDSKMHYRVQDMIANSLEKEAITMTPDDLGQVWSSIEKHIEMETQMVSYVEETLSEIEGRRMLTQEYLLRYLKADEMKHDALLSLLESVKKGMYPYA
ncbi:MAG: hypothetical protein GY838_09740 [bacterium]|nr:hypothetical protein [bacterium]